MAKIVRSSTLEVLDTPEALTFLVGDRLDPAIRRDLKVRLMNYTIYFTQWPSAHSVVGAGTACHRKHFL